MKLIKDTGDFKTRINVLRELVKLNNYRWRMIRDDFGSIPGIFYLSDKDLMIPGRSLLDFPELSLTARISFSGNPIANKGDIYGEASYNGNIDNIIQMNQIVE